MFVIYVLRLFGLQAVITRVNSFTNVAYKDDPTIIAWELINEPRCCSDSSGDTLQVVKKSTLLMAMHALLCFGSFLFDFLLILGMV